MGDTKRLSMVLWIVQGLLALFFGLGSGAPKLLLPVETLPMPIPLPDLFVRFIGVAEVLGALGLVLPGLLHVRPGLTPLAAAGLVLVTIGATVYQLAAGQPESALFAAVVGLIAVFVAYGRWRLAPLRRSSRRAALQPAN
ncbi:DoxX family protein [Actinocrinis sp.]|uniref:DoxX family protein n=1 Tax=Actinocrinis sp. TaxID=1920516 RepID=UPI002D251FBC|nr:DoxX family protein [Actinocrinis sp.]HZP53964.1 DoxX family protein [Actinocrinis sp.]